MSGFSIAELCAQQRELERFCFALEARCAYRNRLFQEDETQNEDKRQMMIRCEKELHEQQEKMRLLDNCIMDFYLLTGSITLSRP